MERLRAVMGAVRRVRMLTAAVEVSARLPSALLLRRDRPMVETVLLLLVVVCELDVLLLLVQLSVDFRGSAEEEEALSSRLGC